MPTLKITKLECVKKRDPFGKDEIDIYTSVDGGADEFLSGPHFLDKSKNDDEVKLSEEKAFGKEIKVRLKERNGEQGGNNDLDLDDLPLGQEDKGDGPKTHPFIGNNGGVVYHLTYEVT